MARSFRITTLWVALAVAGALVATAEEPVPVFPADRDSSGNRLVAHDLPLDTMAYRSYRLDRPIVWTGGAITSDGPVWHLRTADGRTTRLHIPVDRNGFPGLAVMENIDAPSPAPLARAGAASLEQPLPDGQPAITRDGDLVSLSGPTSAYPHGILGDAIEASRIVIQPADGSDAVMIELSPRVAEERGVLEYYDANLEVYAAIPGFSSHAIGSPNLGDAVIANVDGGESWEVVLPDQRRTRLSAVSLTRQGPRVVWSHDLGARVSGNVSSMSTPGMSAMLVPTSDGTLHIWTTRRR